MRAMIVALLVMKIHPSSEKIYYFFKKNLVCFIHKLIKPTDKNEHCDDSDSRSFSTELSETKV